MKYNSEKITKNLIMNGLFSEYLPQNFNISCDDFDISTDVDIKSKNDYIEPYRYTMSRFSENDKRRVISLPEITAYLTVVKFMKDEGLIKELIDQSIDNKKSFSKLIQSNGELSKYEQDYVFSRIKSQKGQEKNITFISNIIKKVNIAKGAKGVLYLDISNFFGSIYTHIIPSIVLGYENAMDQFKKWLKDHDDETIDRRYLKYQKLDIKIRVLNGNRTNGILTGPLVSKLIAEALLTKIDSEIESKGINFTRYMDDYEVYIYDDRYIEQITNTIDTILNKYHLSLNNEKTKYVSFPYYKFENLEKIIKEYSCNLIFNFPI